MRRKGPQPPDVARFLNHDTRARRPHDGPGSAPPRGVRPCPHTFALQPTSPLAEAVERREVSRSCAVPMELSPRRNACLPLGEARLRRRVVVTRHGSWWIWRLPGGLGLDAEENRPGAGRSRPRSGRADEERLFPSDPRSSVRGETVAGSAALLGRRSRRVGRSTFGSSAAREGPVALRPGLASGLPLSCRLWSPTG